MVLFTTAHSMKEITSLNIDLERRKKIYQQRKTKRIAYVNIWCNANIKDKRAREKGKKNKQANKQTKRILDNFETGRPFLLTFSVM